MDECLDLYICIFKNNLCNDPKPNYGLESLTTTGLSMCMCLLSY
jgi:hypothetical protein